MLRNYLVVLMVIIGVVGCGGESSLNKKEEVKSRKKLTKRVLISETGKNLTKKEKLNQEETEVEEQRYKISYKYDKNGNLEKSLYGNGNGNLRDNYVYNEKGKKIEEVRRNSAGTELERTKWKYDKHGNLKEKLNRDYEYKEMEKEKYRYDKNGNIINKITYKEGILFGKSKKRKKKIIYSYTSFGKKDREIHIYYKMLIGWIGYPRVTKKIGYDYNDKEQLIFKKITWKKKIDTYLYTYNENGKETEKKYTNGKLVYKYGYKYDKKGRKKLVTKKDANNHYISKSVYKYNKNGSYSEKYYKYKNEKKWLNIFTKNNKEGKEVESRLYKKNGDLAMYWKHEYNENGLRTRKLRKSRKSDGKIGMDLEYKFKYDKYSKKVQEYYGEYNRKGEWQWKYYANYIYKTIKIGGE